MILEDSLISEIEAFALRLSMIPTYNKEQEYARDIVRHGYKYHRVFDPVYIGGRFMQVGLMRDTGKKWGKGCKVYDFPWFDEQINEPFAVLKSTHIQHSTEQVQNTTLQTETKSKPTTSDPFLESWELLIADLPNEMKSKLNYTQARPTFTDCLANGWDKYPEQLKDNVMSRIEPGHTEPGKLVNVLKEIATIKPTKPIIKCDYDNCNGNYHESVDSGLPYLCTNRRKDF